VVGRVEIPAGEPSWLVAVEDNRCEDGVDARVTEAECWGSLTIHQAGLGEFGEDGFAMDRVVADALDAEEASVGGEADLPQGGQVLQPFADPEVAGVVDGGFGPKGLAFLVVLLDPGCLVLDVE
jgi:hypothetical protein